MKNKRKQQPIQPLVTDDYNVVRFQSNKIVEFLLDVASKHGTDLNTLALLRDKFPKGDWEQFAQLIGYSLSGWGTLSYVRDKTYDRAQKKAKKELDKWQPKPPRIRTIKPSE